MNSSLGSQPNGAPGSPASFYDRVGGAGFFGLLVGGFYRRVRRDPLLGPMYPADDWEGAEQRLRDFLIQYWGGPHTYSERRGHPRLYRRHLPFPIDQRAREHWLAHMAAALEEAETKYPLSAENREELWSYLSRTAQAMTNIHPRPEGAADQGAVPRQPAARLLNLVNTRLVDKSPSPESEADIP